MFSSALRVSQKVHYTRCQFSYAHVKLELGNSNKFGREYSKHIKSVTNKIGFPHLVDIAEKFMMGKVVKEKYQKEY